MDPILLTVNLILLWMATVVNILLTLALIRHVNSTSKIGQLDPDINETLSTGQPAPEFSTETLEGDEVTLEDYRGKNAAFIFMAPNCGPCIESLASWGNLSPKAARHGVELILVSIATNEQTREFVDKYKVELPVLLAPRLSNPFASDYKITGTPSYCLVDHRGIVQSVGITTLKNGTWETLSTLWNSQISHQ